MRIRSSFENQPYADYPNDDAYFESLFTGRTIAELADMNLTEEEVEGVSGATMTSMAMAEGIVKTAGDWEQESLSSRMQTIDLLESQRLWVIGSNIVCRLCGLYPPWKNQILPDHPANSLVCYLGLVNGDILSQALFAAGHKVACRQRAPILALLSLAALIIPMATGKSFYCHQLCPHGAAQQWMRKLRKNDSGSQRIGQNIKTCTHWAPFSVVFLALVLLLTPCYS